MVLKVDHELIRSGPYRYLRHPIYTGVLLAVAGTALDGRRMARRGGADSDWHQLLYEGYSRGN